MSSWGFGPFDNDIAAIVLENVADFLQEENFAGMLERVLCANYIDGDDAQIMIAICHLLCSDPALLEQKCGCSGASAVRRFRGQAPLAPLIDALKRIATVSISETASLWNDAQEPQWFAVIEELCEELSSMAHRLH